MIAPFYSADNWSCLLQADTAPVRAVQSFYTFKKCKVLILLAFWHVKYLYNLARFLDNLVCFCITTTKYRWNELSLKKQNNQKS